MAVWDSTGTILAVSGELPTSGSGGFANTDEFRMYRFDGSSVFTPLTSKDFGYTVRSIAWNPSGTILAIGGENPTNGAGGFNNTDEVRLYTANFTALSSSDQSVSKSIVFGNSALGSLYDLNVEVLGGAHVTIKGIVFDDSV